MDDLLEKYNIILTIGRTFDRNFKVKLMGILNRRDEQGQRLESAMLPVCWVVDEDLGNAWKRVLHYAKEALKGRDFRQLVRTRMDGSAPRPESEPGFEQLAKLLSQHTLFVTVDYVSINEGYFVADVKSPRCAIGYIVYGENTGETVAQAIEKAIIKANKRLS